MIKITIYLSIQIVNLNLIIQLLEDTLSYHKGETKSKLLKIDIQLLDEEAIVFWMQNL